MRKKQKNMWSIVFAVVLFAVLVISIGTLLASETNSNNKEQPVKKEKYDKSKLLWFETDKDMEQTKIQALAQYKVCPPLRPDRFRRRVKML